MPDISPVEPVTSIVPLASGNSIVLSAVGSVALSEVSKSSCVAPSNIRPEDVYIVPPVSMSLLPNENAPLDGSILLAVIVFL